jgi:hypothetical protein
VFGYPKEYPNHSSACACGEIEGELRRRKGENEKATRTPRPVLVRPVVTPSAETGAQIVPARRTPARQNAVSAGGGESQCENIVKQQPTQSKQEDLPTAWQTNNVLASTSRLGSHADPYG